MVNGWKVTAIIFIILFTLETAFLAWGTYLTIHEENIRNECYYDFCSGYEDAMYNTLVRDNICYCYDEDYNIAKKKYMK